MGNHPLLGFFHLLTDLERNFWVGQRHFKGIRSQVVSFDAVNLTIPNYEQWSIGPRVHPSLRYLVFRGVHPISTFLNFAERTRIVVSTWYGRKPRDIPNGKNFGNYSRLFRKELLFMWLRNSLAVKRTLFFF